MKKSEREKNKLYQQKKRPEMSNEHVAYIGFIEDNNKKKVHGVL